MKNFILLLLGFSSIHLHSQNQMPVVTNLQATYNASNFTTQITYNLSDAEGSLLTVSLWVDSTLEGNFHEIQTGLSGDVGQNISVGNAKTIEWQSSLTPTMYTFKVVADDGQELNLQEIVDQVSTSQTWNHLLAVEGVRDPVGGAVKLQEVRQKIITTFDTLGFKVQQQAFPYAATTGLNIIGKKSGLSNSEAIYIIDGHYDAVAGSPGADDNASAVAGVIEAARVLSKFQFNKSIHFIGFDLEEAGLKGSEYYINNTGFPLSNIEGVINFEMIGYYSDSVNSQYIPVGFDLLFPTAVNQINANQNRGDFINVVDVSFASDLKTAYQQNAAAYVPGLRVINLTHPDNFQVNDLLRSDHATFWEANVPALMLTDGANYRNLEYHTPSDVSANLDSTFLANVVRAAIATIADLAQPRHVGAQEVVLDLTLGRSEHACVEHVKIRSLKEGIYLDYPDCLTKQNITLAWHDVLGRTVDQLVLMRGATFISWPDVEGKEFVLKVSSEGKSISRLLIKP